MMKTHTTTIDGITYETRTLPATDGLVIMPKLLAMFGEPVLRLVFSVGDDDRAELLSDPKVVASLLYNVSQNAAETDGLLVVKDLLVTTKADKVRIGDTEVEAPVSSHFDSHFAGRYGHLAQVAMWVAQCNFIAP